MLHNTGKLLHQIVRGYWILLVVLAFGLLSIYTSHPIYGAQAATPTPDVNTVPDPIAAPTPENTPFPTPTPVRANSSSDNGGATAPGNNNPGGSNADNDNDNSDNNSESSSGPTTGGGGATTSPATGNGGTTPTTAVTGTVGATGLVTAVTLNLRKDASTTAPVIDTLFLNDQVALLARNQGGDWFYVCCGARTKLAGWVSKQFVATTLIGDQAMTLIPLFASATNQTAATVPPVNTGNKAGAGSLVLEMRPLPSAAWQGQSLAIQFVVRNRSNQAMTGVQLRNDLPDELAVLKEQIGNQGKVTYSGGRQRGPVITIDWPTVPANGQVSATVTVQIATDVADGALIDNLAVVKASQGAEALAGITLAMPPVALPQFR